MTRGIAAAHRSGYRGGQLKPGARSVPDSSAQLDLFGRAAPEPEMVGPATPTPEHLELASRLPAGLRLGTSSWSFPGWAGLVYARRVGESTLAREGLAAYAQHPLLRAVGVDRTFYAPLTAAEFARYAQTVSPEFRFLVKAHAPITTPPEQLRARAFVAQEPDRFLDAAYAIDRVVGPVVEGLGTKLGVVLFQFPPLVFKAREAPAFTEQLGRFLEALPRGPQYAVELRNRELLGPAYVDALARNGATHCFNVHPRMPGPLEQANLLGEAAWLSGTVAIRWMLHPQQDYEAARERYFPFDRLIDPDPQNRAQIAELLDRVLARGNDALVIANNKSEGSAPQTLFMLAREFDRRVRPRRPAGP